MYSMFKNLLFLGTRILKEARLTPDIIFQKFSHYKYVPQVLHFSIMSTFGHMIYSNDPNEMHIIRMIDLKGPRIIHVAEWAATDEVITKTLDKAWLMKNDENVRNEVDGKGRRIKFIYSTKKQDVCKFDI